MDGPYFIHLPDPGFPEAPWPNVRRLGPYPTLEEAEEQAASDFALGHVAEVPKIFDETGSLALEIAETAEEHGHAKSHLRVDRVQARVEELRAGQAEAFARAAGETFQKAETELGVTSGGMIRSLYEAGLLRFQPEEEAALRKIGLI